MRMVGHALRGELQAAIYAGAERGTMARTVKKPVPASQILVKMGVPAT